jgi:hypothetical protein
VDLLDGRPRILRTGAGQPAILAREPAMSWSMGHPLTPTKTSLPEVMIPLRSVVERNSSLSWKARA